MANDGEGLSPSPHSIWRGQKSVGEEARVGRGAVGTIHHRKKEGAEAVAASMPMQTEGSEVVGDSCSKAIRITPWCLRNTSRPSVETEKPEGPLLVSDLVVGII